jgi:dolichol-phosphate mannosyltransferase
MRNEHAAVQPFMSKLASAMEAYEGRCRIIVVDGVSTDGTPDAVRRHANGLSIEVIELKENLGLGGALEAGLQQAVTFADVVITMDGDDSHDPDTIPSMLAKIEEGADVVIASRFEPGGEEVGVAGHRKVLSHAASGLLRTLFPVGQAKDYSSGFRAYRTDALRSVADANGTMVEESGFSCMMELLLKLRSVGADVREVPLVLRYDLKPTESKMNIGHTIGRYVVVIGRNLPTAGRRPAPPRV